MIASMANFATTTKVLSAQNTQPNSGVAPAGSTIEIKTSDVTTLVVQVANNTLNQSVVLQATIDGVNWVTLGGTPLLRQSTGGMEAAIAGGANGIWTANVADFIKVRLSTNNAATTGSGTFSVAASDEGAGFDIMNTPIFQVQSGQGAFAQTAAGILKGEDAVHNSGDAGIEMLGVRNDNHQTAFTSANGDYSPVGVDYSGAVYIREKGASIAVAPAAFALGAATNTQILAANAARRGATVINRSGQTVYLRYGATAASASLYTWELLQGEKLEVPFQITAAIQAISVLAGSAVAAGVGLFVTEFQD